MEFSVRRIPIPMCDKKIWVQQENSYKISYLFTCISNLILAIHTQSVNGYEFNMSPEMEVLLFYNLCRNVPYFYDTFMWPFLAPVSPLTSRFPLIMVVSGFGPYHYQQPDDAPAECAGITPTPWAIMPTLGFVLYCWGHELLVTPPPTPYLLVLFSR